MADGQYRRRMGMVDQSSVTMGGFPANDGVQPPTRSNRPLSWHPSSHLAPQPTYNSSYAIPKPDTNEQFTTFDLPQTPAIYSGYASPDSTFSPSLMPYSGYDQPQFAYPDSTAFYPSNPNYIPFQASTLVQQTPSYLTPPTQDLDPSMYSHFDWTNFSTSGFESSTAPPTPKNLLPIQNPDPVFPTEESIPYHSLSDSESEGEELIGMGLYDAPEVSKTPSCDPQLDNYRALMMSQLLGSGHRQSESTGKGLKLEETWNPPPSDDEDDEEDEDEDGEGEDEEEPTVEAGIDAGSGSPPGVSATAHIDTTGRINDAALGSSNVLTNTMQANYVAQTYDRNGWL